MTAEAQVSVDLAGAVVVGVDDTPPSREALRYALAEGVRRSAPVRVVTAWVATADVAGGSPDPDQVRADATAAQEAAVREALALLGEQPPVVTREVVFGYGADVLVESARGAALLVVGHTPRRWPARAVLGSVGEQCVRRSSAPVVVVPLTAAPAVHGGGHRRHVPHAPGLAPGVF